jgi:hypothetical protein
MPNDAATAVPGKRAKAYKPSRRALQQAHEYLMETEKRPAKGAFPELALTVRPAQ